MPIHACLNMNVCDSNSVVGGVVGGDRFLEHVHLLRLWPSVGAMFTVSTRTHVWLVWTRVLILCSSWRS